MADDAAVAVNGDLDSLHDMLIAANERLSRSLDGITDPDLAQAVVTEMREVVHRIDLVQSVLFTEESNEITDAVEEVQAANATLTNALSSITNITKLVNAVTQFLTLVDKAIDLAKTIGV
jgi:hypothetical protein